MNLHAKNPVYLMCIIKDILHLFNKVQLYLNNLALQIVLSIKCISFALNKEKTTLKTRAAILNRFTREVNKFRIVLHMSSTMLMGDVVTKIKPAQ